MGAMSRSLFSIAPLAEALRPKHIGDVVGQGQITDAAASQPGANASLILWGPPGSGKTTIARILGDRAGQRFQPLSAVFDGVSDLRRIFAEARPAFDAGQQTLLFVDEIHRFNKAQQDALLPAVEEGMIRLIGATTENPSFSLNSALLSRVQVLVLNPLDEAALSELLSRAETYLGTALPVDERGRTRLVQMADGDGRYLLNLIETIHQTRPDDAAIYDADALSELLSHRQLNYDSAGDEHYNLISALHKSLRASDCDAGLYWLARMMLSGEDPHYILRRLTRFASEDIGLAAPEATQKAIAAWQSYERLGSPEGDLAIAELVIFLATAPKSNAAYSAWKAAVKLVRQTGHIAPPKHILNAPTSLMKSLDYGKNYAYDHDFKDGFSGQNCFPETLGRPQLYQPAPRGFEREIQKRLDYWARLRQQRDQTEGSTDNKGLQDKEDV